MSSPIDAQAAHAQRLETYFCPECDIPIPPERLHAPWCGCGWGKPKARGSVIYLAHILTYSRKRNGASFEFNIGGNIYEVGTETYVRHLSDHKTRVDPRSVFRVDQGQPYLSQKDLAAVLPHVDRHALFREPTGMRRMFQWGEFLELIGAVVPELSQPPDTSLRAVLVNYAGLSEKVVAECERTRGARSLGQALIERGVCDLETLLVGVLGPSRVFAPQHHHGNHLGRLLLEAGAIDEAQLASALSAQVEKHRPLAAVLSGSVEPQAFREAVATVKKLPLPGPERDGLGEILCEMGAVSRTQLAHALRQQREHDGHIGQILVETCGVSPEALFEAVKRQELKRAGRMSEKARLGQILLARQAIGPEMLEAALIEQVATTRPLGEILVYQGHLTPEQLIAALVEQESKLEALVESRLAEALEKARARREANKKLPPRQAPRASLPLPFFKHVSQGLSLAWLGRWGKVAAVVGGLGMAAGLGYNLVARPPQAPAPLAQASGAAALPPMAKEAPAAGKAALARPPLSTLYATNKVEVHADDIIARMEEGHPNPMGEGYLGAYKAPLPADMVEVSKAVAEAPAAARMKTLTRREPPPPRVAALARSGSRALAEPLALADTPASWTEGDRLMVLDKPREAAAAYTREAAARPQDPEAWRKLAVARHEAGAVAAAAPALSKARQLKGDDPRVLHALGRDHRAAKRHREAATAFAQAAAKAEDPALRSAFHNEQALALEALGQRAQAIAVLEAALKQDATNPDTHANLARLKTPQELKSPTELAHARRHLEAAISGYGERVERHMASGDALRAKKDHLGALRAYQQALAANTRLSTAHSQAGRLAWRSGLQQSARTHLATAETVYHSNAIAHTRIGDAFLSLKERKRAMQEWYTATRIAPKDPMPYYKLGLLAKGDGKPAEARRLMERALRLDPAERFIPGLAQQIEDL